MKVKLREKNVDFTKYSRQGCTTHGDFYKKYGVEIKKEYHPSDDDFSQKCDGWKTFMQDHPEFVVDSTSIELVDITLFTSLLLAEAELLFLLAAEQARLQIPNETENRITNIKNTLHDIAQYKEKIVGVTKIDIAEAIFPVTQKTKLATLRMIPDGIIHYIADDSELPFGLISTCYKCVYFVLKPELKPLPQLKMKYKDNTLVALHVENIPQEVLKLLE